MIEKIKKKLIYKWIKEYEKELLDISLICNAVMYEKVKEIVGDLEICEKVFDSYYSIINM